MIVLDASVLIKWFIQEVDSKLALKLKEGLLRDKINIAVPDLILYEILNVLRFKAGITQEAIETVLPALFTLGLEIITPSQRLLREALYLSFASGLSIYDCIYIALANELNAFLIILCVSILRT